MRKLRMRKSCKKVLSLCAAIMTAAVLASCGGGNTSQNQTTQQTTTPEPTTTQKEVALSEVHEAVKAVYGENYIPNMPFDAQYLADVCGISEDMYEEAIAEGPMISVHVDTFMAFRAKEGQADAIEEKLTAYRDYLLNDTMQYPMNMPKIEASQVVREGDYVFFVMLGQAEDTMAEEDARLKQFKESNQLAVDAINAQFQ